MFKLLDYFILFSLDIYFIQNDILPRNIILFLSQKFYF